MILVCPIMTKNKCYTSLSQMFRRALGFRLAIELGGNAINDKIVVIIVHHTKRSGGNIEWEAAGRGGTFRVRCHGCFACTKLMSECDEFQVNLFLK